MNKSPASILACLCGVAMFCAAESAMAYEIENPIVTLPSAATLAASGVIFNAATLNGNFTAGIQGSSGAPTVGNRTTAYLEYGLTTSYGNTVGSVTVKANTPRTPISAPITSLTAGTTYHFRAVASNRAGVAYGSDFTITTLPLPPVVVLNINDTGNGSLRTVVANALPGNIISFAPNLSGQTILLTSGPIGLSKNVTLDASALTNGISINGNGNNRIFVVNSGVSVALQSLTITNGYQSPGAVGGAFLNQGTLAMENCTLAGNSVGASAAGGAIQNSGQLNLRGCTFSANTAAFAGAISNSSTCALQNCTFYGNSATNGNGGAIDNTNSATLSILHCTFSDNTAVSAGGAIHNYLSLVSLTNSIVAGNNAAVAGGDIYNWSGSTITAVGVNIVQVLGNGGTLQGGNTILAFDPRLGPLANNGGPTKTLLPQGGSPASPAIDTGVTSHAVGLVTDQRGFPRLAGTQVDIGAVELRPSELPNPNIVQNTADSGLNSLRDRVANAAAGSIISFAANLSGQTFLLTSGSIVLGKNVTLDASGLANGISINGNANNRIFVVNSGVSVALKALTLTNGYQAANGGAILNNGTLAMNHCTLVGNSAAPSGSGGAIQNWGQFTLSGCTFSADTAAFSGAINNNATCTLQNCTFYGNSANNGNGGAIDNAFSATLSILQCTFSGNTTVGSGGAIDNYLSQISITNSIFAGNPAEDIYNWPGSTITAAGVNIVQELANDGTLLGGSTILAVDPRLGPLANNGGPTLTLLPQSGSPAIDAGVTTAAAGLLTDQRGLPRNAGSAVDIGAVELQLITSGTLPRPVNLTRLGNGTFQIHFASLTGASFRVVASTNLALPLAEWAILGFATESPAGSGQFQFTDSEAPNFPQRFYSVKSP